MKPRSLRLLPEAAAAALPVAAAAFLFFHNPAATAYLPCPFLLFTGFDCPGCGMTRAAYFLMHLDFVRAFRYNPFIFIWAPLLLLLWGVLLRRLHTGRLPRVSAGTVARCAIGLGGAMIVFDILRNLPFGPFVYFRV